MNNIITKEIVDSAYTYPQYRKLIDDLLKEGKTTSNNRSENLIEYTKINIQRMNRLDKTVEISEDLKKEIAILDKKLTWVILTEAWCGDVAQNLPVIAKIADLNTNIELKILLRDENLSMMDEYLTNGGRAIPKLICLDSDTFEELGTWGPRPTEVQEKFLKDKADPNISSDKTYRNVQLWYTQDKSKSIQKEFLRLIMNWKH